ncbi:ArnT family glycosyltransferase [Rhizorhapis suberifaciens]|uniref:4-amino-4-deoxy-L-arabinose transferase-like glycosyltransferase n=1 Tax=Rhizorhapis suberifaciens TaxID=13656 RepID=A0A840HTJ6_9SPHN|nr:glycosyltransferase family 39 protein [Rhizorhapis suberifaciens]MBB4641253.1 4-amino-4-deoxy-L-arabinose transferase-like glycosyltransferase [Rhizorhapis suberifaciens]
MTVMDELRSGPAPILKSKPSISANSNRTILIGIMIIGALLRFYEIRLPLIDAFSWREASSAMMAENFRERSWNIFFPEVNWTGPGPSYQGREFQLFGYIVALLSVPLGWHDWIGRLVAGLFGLVTLFSLHRLVALIWDEVHAHLAALSYALMPGAIMIDSSFIPDPAMLALITLGIWLFVKYWVTGTAYLLPLATAAFTLGALAKLPGLAAGLIVAYLAGVWTWRGRWSAAAKVLVYGGIGLIVVVAYYAWAVYLGNSYPPYHVAGSGYIWDDGVGRLIRERFYLGSARDTAIWWFYGYPLLLLMAVGIFAPPPKTAEGRDPVLIYIPLLWLVAGGIVYLAAAREMNNNPWNFHFFHIPLAIFAGRGMLLLATFERTSIVAAPALTRLGVILMLVMAGSTFPLVATMKRPYAENAMLMGKRLAELKRPGDLSAVVSPDVGDPIAIYYSRGRGWVFPLGGGDTDWATFLEDDASAIAQLEKLRAEGADWFAVAKNAEDNTGRNFLKHHAGVIAHLNATAKLVDDNERYMIYQLNVH